MIFFEQASLLQHGINFGQVDNLLLQYFCHIMKATFLEHVMKAIFLHRRLFLQSDIFAVLNFARSHFCTPIYLHETSILHPD